MPDIPLDAHVAGRGAGHPRPPGELDVPVTHNALDGRFNARWVEPFYLADPTLQPPVDAAAFVAAARAADERVLDALLAEADWRPRRVGAWFVALRAEAAFEPRLGRLLLRSDTCFAGRAYSMALAALGTAGAADYLQRYLQHYLALPQYDYDQAEAIGALRWLEARLGGTRAAALEPAWQAFAARALERCERAAADLARQLDALPALRALPAPRPAPRPLFPPEPAPAAARPWWRRGFD